MKLFKISSLVKLLVDSVHSLGFSKLGIKEVNDMSSLDKILKVQFKLTQNMYWNMFTQREFEEIRIPDLLSPAQEKKLVELYRSYYREPRVIKSKSKEVEMSDTNESIFENEK